MTVVARRFVAIPERTATATWKAISDLLADPDSEAGRELVLVTGIASSLITREAMTSPIVVYGSGPRVRIYCLYNEDAVEGGDANESALSFNATAGDWRMSLPCPQEDLVWVQKGLRAKSVRVSARDMDEPLEDTEKSSTEVPADAVDMEAFFKS